MPVVGYLHDDIYKLYYHYYIVWYDEMESNKVESPSKWEKLKGIVSRDEQFIWRLIMIHVYFLYMRQ